MAQEIELLTEEIDELTRVMRELGRTVVDIDDAYTKQLKLVTGIEKQSQAVKQNIVAVDKWGNAIKASTEATVEETKAKEDSAKTLKQQNAEARKYIQEQNRTRGATSDLMKEFGSGVSTTQLFTDRLEKSADQMGNWGGAVSVASAALTGLASGLNNYGKALYKGERGAGLAGKYMEGLSKPIIEFGRVLSTAMIAIGLIFPPLLALGVVIKGVVEGLSLFNEFNKLAADQANALYKSFRDLSQAGISTARGMDDVFESLQAFGMTMSEIDEFTSTLSSSTKQLALLAGTAGLGARRFADVAGGLFKGRVGEELELLGVSAKEQREMAMSFMTIQAKTGQLQLKSTKQLVEESGKFAKELDLAAQMAGTTRKEQMQAREAALAEVRFRSALIDAERRGDTGEMDRLRTAQTAAAIAKSFGDERGFTGILQAAAGRGALTTPEAVAAEMTYGIQNIMNTPNQTDSQILEKMARGVDIQQQQLSGINRFVGGIDALQTNVVATADMLKRQQTLQDAARTAGFAGPNAIGDFLQTDQGKRIASGDMTRDMVSATRTQQATAMTMDSLVKQFNGAAELNKDAATAFDAAVKRFGGVVGTITTGNRPTTANSKGQASRSGGDVRSGRSPGGASQADITGVIEPGGGLGYNIVQTADGKKQRREGTRAFRNNNPGNIEAGRFATQQGAVGSDGRFAIFPNKETGDRAREALFFGPAYSSLTLAQAVNKYAPPNENNTDSYIKALSSAAGASPETIVGSLNPDQRKRVMEAMARVEGFKPGTVTAVARNGGVFSGPTTGYRAVLHGNEAVVPLPNGKSIPVSMPDFASGMGKQMEVMNAQITRLDDMISIMRNQLSVSGQILQASRN